MAPASSKISKEFASRLAGPLAGHKVRAVVVLKTDVAAPKERGEKRRERHAHIEAVRKAAEPMLAELDAIIEQHQGKRLGENVNALGCVTVETTANGIRAIASSEGVKAVIEDQPIALLAQRGL